MTMQQLPAIPARDSSACGNSSTVHNASHPATQRKTAASGRGKRLVPAAASVSSAAEIATHGCGNTPV